MIETILAYLIYEKFSREYLQRIAIELQLTVQQGTPPFEERYLFIDDNDN